MIYITLDKIRQSGPCKDGWAKLLAYLGKTKADNEPLPLVTVLDSNGLDDCLWCLRCLPEHDSLWRHYAVDCAEDVAHLLTDERSLEALRVARRHADGLATDAELAAAWATAGDALRAAAWATAGDAAGYALRAAAWATAGDAAWYAARAAARDAAWAAAWYAARVNQAARLRAYLRKGGRP